MSLIACGHTPSSLCRRQGLETAHRGDQLFYSSMIALNSVVLPFAVDVQDTFAREFKSAHLTNHTRIAVGLVSAD